MGWLDAPKYPGVVLGDEPLDETFAFLKQLSRTYESGLGRKPSCEELRVLLETSLVVNADNTLLSWSRSGSSWAVRAITRFAWRRGSPNL